MPKISELPDTLRPYESHGLKLRYRPGDKEAIADCPWCGRDEKFDINVETGMWRCVVCNEGTDNGKPMRGGNAIVFLRMLWERSYEATRPDEWQELATDRKLVDYTTLTEWFVAKSILNQRWLIPGWNVSGLMMTLYQYTSNGRRKFLLPTPTLGHHLFGMNLYDHSKPDLYLAEGLWDPTALWEALATNKRGDNGFTQTANRGASLLSYSNVIGMPSCQTFFEAWLPLFSGKNVYLVAQNDHEKVTCSQCKKSYSYIEYNRCPHCNSSQTLPSKIAPASYNGVIRVARMLGGMREPPLSIHFCKWGEDGWNPSLPSGYDARDYLTA